MFFFFRVMNCVSDVCSERLYRLFASHIGLSTVWNSNLHAPCQFHVHRFFSASVLLTHLLVVLSRSHIFIYTLDVSLQFTRNRFVLRSCTHSFFDLFTPYCVCQLSSFNYILHVVWTLFAHYTHLSMTSAGCHVTMSRGHCPSVHARLLIS